MALRTRARLAPAAALFAAALLVAAFALLPQAARATTTEPAPEATVTPVNTSPGDQTDPHVSGDWVTYTDFSGGGQVRYHNLVSGDDAAIPGASGATDSLSDISGTTASFVRFGSGAHSVYTFDVAAGGDPVELDPQSGSNRREIAVGGRTAAWQDFGLNPTTASPEIVVYDLDTNAETRITTDLLYDRDPQVSSDGTTVTWSKCTTLAGGCQVWEAVRTGTTWTATPLTTGDGESSLPDTNGNVVVYNRNFGGDDYDIVWQPVGGGTESRLPLPSIQQNPSISGDVVLFESYDPSASTPNFDIYAYDLATDRLFRLTDTPEDESLSDVSTAADGTVTAVFSRHEATGDDNVYAERFLLPTTTTTYTGPTSASPGATVTLSATLRHRTTPLDGESVTFALGSQSCVGTTDSTGSASCQVTLDQPAGPNSVTASFAGDATYDPSSSGAQPFTINSSTVAARVQPPINADGSSTFTAKRGVIPVTFTLSDNGTPTCDLPPATITVTRIGTAADETVDESTYSNPADSGSNFRTSGCDYVYNLAARNLGRGTYRVGIVIGGQQVGSAEFELR